MSNFVVSYLQGSPATDGETVNGRKIADSSFIEALARKTAHGASFPCFRPFGGDDVRLRELICKTNPSLDVRVYQPNEAQAISEHGTLYWPSPIIRAPILQRKFLQSPDYSVVGVTHSLSGRAVMESIGTYVDGYVEEYDALICTSRAARSAVETVVEASRAIHSRQDVDPRIPRIKLPVIPLGIWPEEYSFTDGQRRAARDGLRIEREEIVILSFGRLCHKTKVNHHPLIQLARQVIENGFSVRLIFAGYPQNKETVCSLERIARECERPLQMTIINFPNAKEKKELFSAADIYISLSDNLQETFGLAIVEAMAAGLPCVVSDWSGHRDLIENNVSGFLVPTFVPQPTLGVTLASTFSERRVSDEDYVHQASLRTVVDLRFALEIILRLCSDKGLRQKIGRKAKIQASEKFDWNVVLRQHVELRQELSSIRRSAKRSEKTVSSISPFELFRSYASEVMDRNTVISRGWSGALVDPALDSMDGGLALTGIPERILDIIGEKSVPLDHLYSELPTYSTGLISASVIWMMKNGALFRE